MELLGTPLSSYPPRAYLFASLFGDFEVCKPSCILQALTLQVLLKRNDRDKDSANKAAVAQALISAVQAVQSAIAEAQGGASTAAESAEVPGAQLAIAEAAANSFQVLHALHCPDSPC